MSDLFIKGGQLESPESEEPIKLENIGAVKPVTAIKNAVVTRDAGIHKARRLIVYILLFMVFITIVMPFWFSLHGCCLTDKHWEFLHIIFPAEIGLLGAALSFYFDRRDG